jgi:hypothetical protein
MTLLLPHAAAGETREGAEWHVVSAHPHAAHSTVETRRRLCVLKSLPLTTTRGAAARYPPRIEMSSQELPKEWFEIRRVRTGGACCSQPARTTHDSPELRV